MPNWDAYAPKYATANQLTERETYANQLDPTYLENREPYAFLQLDTPEARKDVVKKYMEKESVYYKQQIDQLTKELEKEDNHYKKAKISQKIHDIEKFFVLQNTIDPEDRHYYVMIRDDIPEHLAKDPFFQIKFESHDSRKRRNDTNT